MSEDPLTTDPDAMNFTAPVDDAPDPASQLTDEQKLLLEDPHGLIPQSRAELQPSEKVHEQSEPWQDGIMNQSYQAARRLWENKELQKEANYDSLTGLLNQKGFNEVLNRKIEDAEDESFALLFFDLTSFKKVNDEKGHPYGDKVLKDFAHFLEEHTRKGNGIPGDELSHFGDPGRAGGDEFMGLFNLQPRKNAPVSSEELTPQQRVETITDHLLNGFKEYLDTQPELQEMGFDVAIGAALYKKGMTAEQLVHAADQSMYEHKQMQHAINGGAYR